jgi:hypothetical protein
MRNNIYSFLNWRKVHPFISIFHNAIILKTNGIPIGITISLHESLIYRIEGALIAFK